MSETVRKRGVTGYFLLGPGMLWLLLFFLIPFYSLLAASLFNSGGSDFRGYTMVYQWSNYTEVIKAYWPQIVRSLIYGGIATLLTFLVGFPVAYTIAFRGGRYKSFLLFLVIAPFFTSFLIRTISWKILLNDTGPVLGPLKELHLVPPEFGLLYTPIAVVAGITYNFLPFMVLPLYVALEKIDPKLIEAAKDLYASGWGAFRRVTFPLSLPGVFAGTILTFIPALGDWVNAELLGNTQTKMIGNVIQDRFISQGDYPTAAALSFILMALILVALLVYARVVGTDKLTG